MAYGFESVHFRFLALGWNVGREAFGGMSKSGMLSDIAGAVRLVEVDGAALGASVRWINQFC